jgi:TPR repeat protein
MEKYVTNIKDLVIQTLTNGAEIKAKAESGDALSCFQMGMIHLLGINTPIDFKKASKYLGNQSLSNDPDANRLLGFIAECEGNYSQAFKNYANAGKANRPYINKVSEERVNLQGLFKKLELPSTVQNKIITNVLNEYIKSGDTKVEASIRIAMICEDEESCLDAAQSLYDAEDYYSAMSWLQKGNIPDSNSLYASVKDKISDSKGTLDLPTTLDVI